MYLKSFMANAYLAMTTALLRLLVEAADLSSPTLLLAAPTPLGETGGWSWDTAGGSSLIITTFRTLAIPLAMGVGFTPTVFMLDVEDRPKNIKMS